MTADDSGKPPAVTLATMERLSSLGSTDAVKMRTSVTSMRIEGSSSTTSTVSPKFPCGISAHASLWLISRPGGSVVSWQIQAHHRALPSVLRCCAGGPPCCSR